jgi:tRNA-Thr(GGU) m(6)t(6)A37 methyltransferase TsaA
MLRCCDERDFETIYTIVNDGAQAYKGIIPADRWTEPYMSREKLRHEIEDGVVFWGHEVDGALAGVMGLQDVQDVTLIRHAYVRTASRNQGIGGTLLSHLRTITSRPVLIGTWADAVWAIGFYEKHGFRVVDPDEKDRLLKKYWNVPERQVETSVVLAETGRRPYEIRPIGIVESPLVDRRAAPRQGDEGGPDAWLVFDAGVSEGIRDLRVGADIILLTWLDRARRDVLAVHPRGNSSNPLTGVFSTRSPDRPNPIGLHRVRVVSIDGCRVQVSHLEAINGTPIVDVKPVLGPVDER